MRDGLASGEIRTTDFITTVFSGTSFNSISGVNIWLTGSTTALSLDGATTARLIPQNTGSPAVFNQVTQAGSFVTGAGSGGSPYFALPFANTNYYITLSPRQYAAGGGSVVPWISGTKQTTYCWVIGAASTGYEYIAIGQA